MHANQPPAWHALSAQQCCAQADSHERGLASSEAETRLRTQGPNAIPHKPPPSLLAIFLSQFRNPIIYILLAAAVVSLLIGHATDAAFIGLVVLINALIGGWQERRAEQSARALRQMLRTRAFAQRDGEVVELDAEQLVVGDAIWLESGNRVPADARLLSANGLEVDESFLTGESLAVSKDAGLELEEPTPVADRVNMVFAGAMVVRGRAKGLVVETGADTQVGRLALDVMGAPSGKPPLLVRLERFTRVVGIGAICAATLVGILGVTLQDHSVSEMFLFAIALAVSAIPEGLPIAITVALAVAATRMARRGVIVRKLGAVEGLGSCTRIASDKTGTLTCNELTVREIALADGTTLEVTGEGFTPSGSVTIDDGVVERGELEPLDALARASVLCNEADLHQRDGGWAWRGDPTDIALLAMAHKMGWSRGATTDKHPQVAEIPFEPELRFAASFNRDGEGVGVHVKGAPERVLAMSALSDDERDALRERAESMGGQGYRVLAIATGAAPPDLRADSVAPEPDSLRLLGFVGMIDPLRAGVREAVADCARAGIVVSMVTGDHPTTALAIARDLGMADSPEQVVRGDVPGELEGERLEERIGRARVFARVAPSQKLDIVRASQAHGDFVAVTGDGANDAPALRAANIGVAMGRSGTDVAREASDLVVSDDNFATIVAGVEEGRVAYDNIRKVVFLLVSTGAAEMVLVMLAVATGSPLPLLPAQLLWLNLVTNGIQDVALAFEPPEGDVLARRPRSPRERVFNRLLTENCIVSSVLMGTIGFVAFRWMLAHDWSVESARNALLLLMVLFENVHIGVCRSETRPGLSISPLRSPLLLAGALGALLVHVLMMYLPIGTRLLGTTPVSVATWGALAAVALGFFTLVELHKLRWRYWPPRSMRRDHP